MPHRYRLATKLRIFSLLYSREKLVHVHVDDLHKHFFSLFRFDVNLGYAANNSVKAARMVLFIIVLHFIILVQNYENKFN